MRKGEVDGVTQPFWVLAEILRFHTQTKHDTGLSIVTAFIHPAFLVCPEGLQQAITSWKGEIISRLPL